MNTSKYTEEQWAEIGTACKDTEAQILGILEYVNGRASKRTYKPLIQAYECLGSARSELEEEMLRQHPDYSFIQPFTDVFFGPRRYYGLVGLPNATSKKGEGGKSPKTIEEVEGAE